ncbi:MAG TPA: HPr family phosphocarrier protein [Candidatus Limnocylindria bacterium]
MPSITLEIRNRSGLHARPAALFVQTAMRFEADVTLANMDRDRRKSSSARSLLGVLGLGVSRGHRIRIEANGTDADEALASLRAMVESGLGEPVVGEAES